MPIHRTAYSRRWSARYEDRDQITVNASFPFFRNGKTYLPWQGTVLHQSFLPWITTDFRLVVISPPVRVCVCHRTVRLWTYRRLPGAANEPPPFSQQDQTPRFIPAQLNNEPAIWVSICNPSYMIYLNIFQTPKNTLRDNIFIFMCNPHITGHFVSQHISCTYFKSSYKSAKYGNVRMARMWTFMINVLCVFGFVFVLVALLAN